MEPLLVLFHDFGYVCKLKKELYGLKQVPRAWFEKFTFVISSLGFFLVVMIILSLLSVLMQVVSFFLYMLRT